MADYITIAEAQTYFDGRLNTDPWDCASDTDKAAGITQATAIIDRLNYQGQKADDAQTNEFPRCEDTVVPQKVKDACAEIVLALLDGVNPELEYENLFMISQGYANVRSSYDRLVKAPHILSGIPSFTAWTLLQPFLRDPNTVDLNRTS